MGSIDNIEHATTYNVLSAKIYNLKGKKVSECKNDGVLIECNKDDYDYTHIKINLAKSTYLKKYLRKSNLLNEHDEISNLIGSKPKKNIVNYFHLVTWID